MSHEGFTLPDELDTGLTPDEENVAAESGDDTPPRVASWQRSLLDLSLRNPLLKLPRGGKDLDLHIPLGALPVLDDLMHDGKPIRIVAQDTIDGMHELQGVHRAQELPDEMVAAELRDDHRVHGAVAQSGYVTRMRGLQRDARTVEQETGSNYLYDGSTRH